MKKTRFVIVGTGNRGLGCFAKGLLGFESKGLPEFPQLAELVALVESNPTRGRVAAAELRRPELPVCATVREAQRRAPADWCIVTTPDYAHRAVVVEALEAGLNVLVDKPLATSAWECDQILQTMRRTGRQVIVGHNMRYQPWTLRAAQLVREGLIGDVLTVEAAEVLDYSHGGDYFHRWHSDFTKSAGLMNHKCCHQLDVLCWILDGEPVSVASWGGRRFYRPRPDLKHGPRCLECGLAKTCPHYFNMDKWDGVYRRLYKEAEGDDGYVRDLCVFSDRHTICDHQTVMIRFAAGTLATFTMVTFAPREFCYFLLTGTRGRLELGTTSTDGKPYLRLTDASGKTTDYPTTADHGEHGHGGADIRLIADRLGLGESDPLQRAKPEEARRAVLIADLASRSLAQGGAPVGAEAAGRDFPPAPPREGGTAAE
jgi:predicted dehydrogenase